MNCISVHLRVGHLMSPAGFGWEVEGDELFPCGDSARGQEELWEGTACGFFLFILGVGLSDPFSQASSCVVAFLQAFVASVCFS